jgi:hypothetical protein
LAEEEKRKGKREGLRAKTAVGGEKKEERERRGR